MNLRFASFTLPFFLIFVLGCTHTSTNESTSQSTENRNVSSERNLANAANDRPDWIQLLPRTEDAPRYMSEITAKVSKYLKKPQNDPDVIAKSERIAKYTAFMLSGCSEVDGPNIMNCTKEKGLAKFLSRLFKSSTQFIFCENPDNLACIERTPQIPIQASYRVETPADAAKELWKPRSINAVLDNITEWSFTTQIFVPSDQVDLTKTMAKTLENKINTDGRTAIYTSLYGIDDMHDSMKGVYTAMINKINDGVDVQAVFDEEIRDKAKSKARSALFPFIFSYQEPRENINRWILTPFTPPSGNITEQTVLPFQYNGGTQGLIRALSKNAADINGVKGRIEWPDNGIMHNKFFIMKNQNSLAVWTGTANISETCMGRERNSNMGLYIKNNELAQPFLDEFKEMYDYAITAPAAAPVEADVIENDEEETANLADEKRVLLDPRFPFRHGKFKTNKKPNTHRYFTLTEGTNTPVDDTEFRIYFSPTDDAEHRAILPMLYSARRGDIIRISMFGAAGIEYVRALQLASSRGVKVEVIIDSPTGFGGGSWASNKKSDATLLEKNPFGDGTKIEIRKNKRGPGDAWKQNHQKIGLLLRKQANGSYISEHIILGSQNWSASGNDVNDENLVSIRNRTKTLSMGDDFNKHFTEFLWPRAATVN
ncbi:MAG: phospholipase D-like domain-containing protein [Pseudobdellovibrionaceae bacterium]